MVWDVRRSSNLKTYRAQRSPMTALAVQSKLPILATGSHAQFIKTMTLEGDSLQVIRYHEDNSGHRIGPVSCLAFHRNRLLLAAGGTDNIISVYAPRWSPRDDTW